MSLAVRRYDREERFLTDYGPWAVVTGASDGIGRAIARELARKGFGLVLVARGEAMLKEVAADLSRLSGIETRVVPADLGSDAGIAAVDAATSQLDVGLLVAAAGFGTSGPFLSSDVATELDMIAVNCRAVASLSHSFGRRFVARGRGGIVLLSSLVAFQGVPREPTIPPPRLTYRVSPRALRLN